MAVSGASRGETFSLFSIPPVKYKHALEQAAGYLPKHLRYLLGVVLTSSPYHWHWIKLELPGTHCDI